MIQLQYFAFLCKAILHSIIPRLNNILQKLSGMSVALWCSCYLSLLFLNVCTYNTFHLQFEHSDIIIRVEFIKKIQQDATMYQNFIIPYLYEAQHVSGDTPPLVRSLKLHWQPLVFHMWKVVVCVVGGHCQAHCVWRRPTTFHVWKTRGCQSNFRLLMMGGVSPETCWASYEYGIIKFWYIVASCWIFLYELYCDAQIHELQVSE